MKVVYSVALVLCSTPYVAYAQTAALSQAWLNFDTGMNRIMSERLMSERLSKELLSSERQSRVQGRSSYSQDDKNAVSTVYEPSQVRRRANIAQFVRRARAVDPVGAAEMERLFASTDIIASLSRELVPYGLRVDDVADAYSVYWMSAWQAAHQDTSDPSRATAQAVRRQAAGALSSNPAFLEATEAQKQEFAEALLVQAALISASQSKYKDDATMADRLASSVRQGATASGLDLDAIRLTPDGFVPVRKTGAADPAPGAEPQALAATGDAGSRPGYGFLAAAGGAGLGAAFLMGKAMGRKG